MWRSWNPIPHSFVVHSFFQLIQWILCSSCFWPHQYLVRREFILLHMEFGNLKRLMEYVGIACATVWISISRPVFEMNFSFHPLTLLVIFSCSYLKVLTFDLPLAIGNPRYLSQSVITLAPSNCHIVYLISGLVFLLKNNEVFCLLMAWPEVSSYCPKRRNNL